MENKIKKFCVGKNIRRIFYASFRPLLPRVQTFHVCRDGALLFLNKIL